MTGRQWPVGQLAELRTGSGAVVARRAASTGGIVTPAPYWLTLDGARLVEDSEVTAVHPLRLVADDAEPVFGPGGELAVIQQALLDARPFVSDRLVESIGRALDAVDRIARGSLRPADQSHLPPPHDGPQPTRAEVGVVLAQLERDRQQPYWQGRSGWLDGAQSWLLSLQDWLPADEPTAAETPAPRDGLVTWSELSETVLAAGNLPGLSNLCRDRAERADRESEPQSPPHAANCHSPKSCAFWCHCWCHCTTGEPSVGTGTPVELVSTGSARLGSGRDPSCVKRWPECWPGEFNSKCCRFPKSCSVDVLDDEATGPVEAVSGGSGDTERQDGPEPIDLPAKQELVMDVLAARHRLGDNCWTFTDKVRGAVRELAARGLVIEMGGVIEHTIRASLTETGRARWLSDSYVSADVERLTAEVARLTTRLDLTTQQRDAAMHGSAADRREVARYRAAVEKAIGDLATVGRPCPLAHVGNGIASWYACKAEPDGSFTVGYDCPDDGQCENRDHSGRRPCDSPRHRLDAISAVLAAALGDGA